MNIFYSDFFVYLLHVIIYEHLGNFFIVFLFILIFVNRSRFCQAMFNKALLTYLLTSNPVDGLYSRKQIEKFGVDLRRKKCRILDSVLKTIPDHLKAEARIACEALKYRDDVFINPNYEIIINGTVIRGPNICNLIINKLTQPPRLEANNSNRLNRKTNY